MFINFNILNYLYLSSHIDLYTLIRYFIFDTYYITILYDIVCPDLFFQMVDHEVIDCRFPYTRI